MNGWLIRRCPGKEGALCNAKRICRLTNRKEIATLAEEVIRCGAVLEEWMAKEKLEGENYDLRVVCRGMKSIM